MCQVFAASTTPLAYSTSDTKLLQSITTLTEVDQPNAGKRICVYVYMCICVYVSCVSTYLVYRVLWSNGSPLGMGCISGCCNKSSNESSFNASDQIVGFHFHLLVLMSE